MARWGGPLVVVSASAMIALGVACATFGAQPAGSSRDASADGEVDRDAESRATLFVCGDRECLAGQEACCSLGPTFACIALDGGKACGALAAEAGVDAGPTLACTTYRNCDRLKGEECCYSPQLGSRCLDNCPSGETSLCTLGEDGCGLGADCKSIAQSTLPTAIGECAPTTTSGTRR